MAVVWALGEVMQVGARAAVCRPMRHDQGAWDLWEGRILGST